MAPVRWLLATQLWHTDAVRGPSTPSWPGEVPAIHVGPRHNPPSLKRGDRQSALPWLLFRLPTTWMAGTSPAMMVDRVRPVDKDDLRLRVVFPPNAIPLPTNSA